MVDERLLDFDERLLNFGNAFPIVLELKSIYYVMVRYYLSISSNDCNKYLSLVKYKVIERFLRQNGDTILIVSQFPQKNLAMGSVKSLL